MREHHRGEQGTHPSPPLPVSYPYGILVCSVCGLEGGGCRETSKILGNIDSYPIKSGLEQMEGFVQVPAPCPTNCMIQALRLTVWRMVWAVVPGRQRAERHRLLPDRRRDRGRLPRLRRAPDPPGHHTTQPMQLMQLIHAM